MDGDSMVIPYAMEEPQGREIVESIRSSGGYRSNCSNRNPLSTN